MLTHFEIVNTAVVYDSQTKLVFQHGCICTHASIIIIIIWVRYLKLDMKEVRSDCYQNVVIL